MKTLVAVTIDTEEEWDWTGPYPTRDLRLTNIDLLPRFQDVCDSVGATVTYFTDHAVMDHPRSRQTMLELSRRPTVEVGMHIHPWNTPPIANPGPVPVRETFLHNLTAELIDAKLNTVHASFVASGLSPTSFRGGRYSCNDQIRDFLRSHGFVAECSVLPMSTWPDDGAPDYRHRGLLPNRLEPRPGDASALWEIPLSIGYTRGPFRFWAWWYELIANTPLSKLRLIGIVERLGIVRKSWLNFEQYTADEMIPFLHQLRRMKLPTWCFTCHSSSLLAGVGPYTKTKADEERVFADVYRVLSLVADWPEVEFCSMSDIARRLEKGRSASR